MATFVDFWILSSEIENFDYLTRLHENSESIENDPTFTREYIRNIKGDPAKPPDFPKLTDISKVLNGYSRSIWFYCYE